VVVPEVEKPWDEQLGKWTLLKVKGVWKTMEAWCAAYSKIAISSMILMGCFATMAPKPFTRCFMRAWM